MAAEYLRQIKEDETELSQVEQLARRYSDRGLGYPQHMLATVEAGVELIPIMLLPLQQSRPLR